MTPLLKFEIVVCFFFLAFLLNTLYISDSNAKLYIYLQFQLSPRKKLIDEMGRKQSKSSWKFNDISLVI